MDEEDLDWEIDRIINRLNDENKRYTKIMITLSVAITSLLVVGIFLAPTTGAC